MVDYEKYFSGHYGQKIGQKNEKICNGQKKLKKNYKF
jgi:hypothetical protein